MDDINYFSRPGESVFPFYVSRPLNLHLAEQYSMNHASLKLTTNFRRGAWKFPYFFLTLPLLSNFITFLHLPSERRTAYLSLLSLSSYLKDEPIPMMALGFLFRCQFGFVVLIMMGNQTRKNCHIFAFHL